MSRMAAAKLRIYHGPESGIDQAQEPSDTVTLPAEEIIPLLADAYNSRRTWLRDFEDDSVTISSDLYEVLVAYRFFNRPSA